MKRVLIYSFFLLIVSPIAAATPMSHVVAVVDSHTLIVERTRVRTTIRLAGVDLPPEFEDAGRQFLERELLLRWVLVEPAPNGASYVFRSPDSMEVNRAVVTTWLVGASTHNATMLGWSNPSGRQPATRASKAPKAPKVAKLPNPPLPHAKPRRP